MSSLLVLIWPYKPIKSPMDKLSRQRTETLTGALRASQRHCGHNDALMLNISLFILGGGDGGYPNRAETAPLTALSLIMYLTNNME